MSAITMYVQKKDPFSNRGNKGKIINMKTAYGLKRRECRLMKVPKIFSISAIYSGFTLIELLVVISIIGILAALALVSYTSAQKQARDTQRKSDLRQYQTALESYANKNNIYVSGVIPTDPSDLCVALTGSDDCPEDPKSADGVSYNYCTNSTSTQYVLWATTENVTGFWVVCSSGKSAQSPVVPVCGAGFDCKI